jgi:hypothetical protein
VDPVPFLPSRLLDLQDFSAQSDIRLVSSESIDTHEMIPEYATLSHCWGPPEKHPLLTTRHNIGDRMLHIAMEDLSQTFRDAVQMTRRLGVRYLWIDSLCILQGDEDDWAKESMCMSAIYGNSYCTLAALGSADNNKGLCQVSNMAESIGSFVDLRFEHQQERPVNIRIFEQHQPRGWQQAYDGDCDALRASDYSKQFSPLRFRAWTLQEKELSLRTIHFGRDQLLWECCEMKATAQRPWKEKNMGSFDTSRMLLRNVEGGNQRTMRWHWYALVQDFSCRSLTVNTDKLPALAGLARQYAACFPGSRYVAGLWSTHLPVGLLWRTATSLSRRYTSYIAPTWSWASLDTSICFDANILPAMITGKVGNSDGGFPSLPRVEEVCTELKHNDEYGVITGGYLTLANAFLARVDALARIPKVEDEDPNHRRLHDPHAHWERLLQSGLHVGLVSRDTQDDIVAGRETFILWVSVHAGLLLLRESSLVHHYRRIGLAVDVDRSVFHGCKSAIITLI